MNWLTFRTSTRVRSWIGTWVARCCPLLCSLLVFACFLLLVVACCMWLHVVARCWSLLLVLVACGCTWLHVVARGCTWLVVVGRWSLLVVAARGCFRDSPPRFFESLCSLHRQPLFATDVIPRRPYLTLSLFFPPRALCSLAAGFYGLAKESASVLSRVIFYDLSAQLDTLYTKEWYASPCPLNEGGGRKGWGEGVVLHVSSLLITVAHCWWSLCGRR